MLFSASDSGGSSRFAPDTWYGQAVLAADTVSGRRSAISLLRRAMGRRLGHANPAAIPVDALTLPDLLAHFAQVDLIDLDLQGSELAVLASSLDGLTEKVARIHIRDPQPADRSGPPAGASGQGWTCLADYGCGTSAETSYGPVTFGDGVQSWLNPTLHRGP